MAWNARNGDAGGRMVGVKVMEGEWGWEYN